MVLEILSGWLLQPHVLLFVGASAGLMAAVKGGWFDQIAGRLADVIMSVPS